MAEPLNHELLISTLANRNSSPSHARAPSNTAGEPCSVGLVAFIDSPLQALNLLEYCLRFSRQVNLVVVGMSNLESTTRTQIGAILSLVRPRHVIFREWGFRRKTLRRARRLLATGLAEVRSHLLREPHDFVVGEYRSEFSWAVLRGLGDIVRTVIVVDDGTATLRIDRRRSAPRSSDAMRGHLKRFALLSAGVIGTRPPARLTFFTTYALEYRAAKDDVIVRNDYRSLASDLRQLPPDDACVYVIGGAHQEGGEVDRGDIQLALELTRFAAQYTGKRVVYMPHRRERAEKLDVLRKEVDVVEPTVPFEIYPLVLGKRPLTIVGYYSSLFVTEVELLGDTVEIIALQIPREFVNAAWLPFIDAIYDYYITNIGPAIQIVNGPDISPYMPDKFE